MRLAAAVLALLMIAPISDGAARTHGNGRKKGRVVRVTRGRSERALVPRWCQIRPDGSATCYGKPPDVNMVGDVVDDVGRKATVRVTQVTPSLDSCSNPVSWEITTETQSGDVSQSNYSWLALFDYRATANTRMVYNNGQIPVPGNRGPGIESVWQAFDDDGDDQAELIVTYYNCDASGAVTQTYGGYCMVYYKRDGSGGYNELRVDNIRQC